MALTLPQKASLLAALNPFRLLEPNALHVLSFSAQEKAVDDGTRLFAAGDKSDGGLVVVDGEVRMVSASGSETLGPGTLIGVSALVSETLRPATATAVGKTRLLLVPRALMQQVLEAHPQSALQLRAHVAETVARTRGLLTGLEP